MAIFVHCLHILWQHQITSGHLTIVPLFTEDEIKPDTFATEAVCLATGDKNFSLIHHVK